MKPYNPASHKHSYYTVTHLEVAILDSLDAAKTLRDAINTAFDSCSANSMVDRAEVISVDDTTDECNDVDFKVVE